MKKALFLVLLIAVFAIQLIYSQSTCEQYGTFSLSNGQFIVQNNVWGATTAQCVTANGSSGFTVSTSAHNQGSVAAYPSIYKGCHWGACTSNSGMPIQVSQLGSAPISFSVSSSRPSGNYNVATEAWLSASSDSSQGYNGGCELMIVLDYHGMNPAGSQVGTFNGYNVYYTNIGWNFVTYVKTGTSSLSVNLKDFINDCMSRGYVQSSWYLHVYEAGFEIMSGGQGLSANSFSFSVSGGGGGATNPPASTTAPTPTPGVTAAPTATPAPGGSTPAPTATPAPGSTAAPTATPAPGSTPAPTSAPTNPPSSGSCTCDAGCSSATSISAPFVKDGTGELCFTASSLGSYINSWNLEVLEVNGVNLTNVWTSSGSLPAKINNLYYVYYKGSFAWSHFEAK